MLKPRTKKSAGFVGGHKPNSISNMLLRKCNMAIEKKMLNSFFFVVETTTLITSTITLYKVIFS